MKKITIASMLVVATMMTSCASYTQTGNVAHSDIDVNANVEMILDLENVKPVTATVKRNTALGISSTNYKTVLDDGSSKFFGGTNKMKRLALAKAKIENNVDVILEPEYTIESHSYLFGLFRNKECTVKGFGVNIKGFK